MARETSNGAGFTKEEEEEAYVTLWRRYVVGFSEMAAVKCAIELGIADVVESHESPVTLDSLSSTLNCSPPLLYRVMRFLVHRGVFKQEPTPQGSMGYVQTPLSSLLMRNGGNSMASLVLLETSPVMLKPWHLLRDRLLLKGASPFEASHGEDLWKFTSKAPLHNELLNDAMACRAKEEARAIVEGCPEVFEGLCSLVDVGGGDGTALSLLVKAFPWIHGINFDLPHVVSAATVRDGVENVGGDMFESIPKANAVLLMSVLHDWGDEECVSILKNCRESIPVDTGKVIIAEAVIDSEEGESKYRGIGLMIDMVMLAHTSNGKERTWEEWGNIIRAAGFTSYTLNRIEAVPSVIVAFP